MKMYVLNLDVLKFGGGWSRSKIWSKNSLSGHGDFFPNFEKNHRVWDLEGIWPLGDYRNRSMCSDVQISSPRCIL